MTITTLNSCHQSWVLTQAEESTFRRARVRSWATKTKCTRRLQRDRKCNILQMDGVYQKLFFHPSAVAGITKWSKLILFSNWQKQQQQIPNQCTKQRVASEAPQPPHHWTHQQLVSDEIREQPRSCLLTLSINPLMPYLSMLMASVDLRLAALPSAKLNAADVTPGAPKPNVLLINAKVPGPKKLLWVAQDTAKCSVLWPEAPAELTPPLPPLCQPWTLIQNTVKWTTCIKSRLETDAFEGATHTRALSERSGLVGCWAEDGFGR